MVLCRTKCLHFPTALWNGTNTREDGKNFASNTYSLNLDNQPLYCVFSSLSPSSMQRGSVHSQFLFTFASLNWKKLFFVRVKWAYCDTSVFCWGLKLPSRWSARDVTHALPANVVPKITRIENGNYKPISMFLVVCSIGEQFNFKTSTCMSAWFIYFFAHKSGAKKRKWKRTLNIYFITRTH